MKHEYVQIQNPKTKKFIKIDKTIGKIVSHKKSLGAYKNIPIHKKQKELCPYFDKPMNCTATRSIFYRCSVNYFNNKAKWETCSYYLFEKGEILFISNRKKRRR